MRLKKEVKRGRACLKNILKVFLYLIEKLLRISDFTFEERIKRLLFNIVLIAVAIYYTYAIFQTIMALSKPLETMYHTNFPWYYGQLMCLGVAYVGFFFIFVLQPFFRTQFFFNGYVYFFSSFVFLYFFYSSIYEKSSSINASPDRVIFNIPLIAFNLGEKWNGITFYVCFISTVSVLFIKDFIITKPQLVQSYYSREDKVFIAFLLEYSYDGLLWIIFSFIFFYYFYLGRKNQKITERLNSGVDELDFSFFNKYDEKERRNFSSFEKVILKIVDILQDYKKALPFLLIHKKQMSSSGYHSSEKESSTKSKWSNESKTRSINSSTNTDGSYIEEKVEDENKTRISKKSEVVLMFCEIDYDVSDSVIASEKIKKCMNFISQLVRKNKGAFHGFMFNLITISSFNCMQMKLEPERAAFKSAEEISEILNEKLGITVTITIIKDENPVKFALLFGEGIFGVTKFFFHSRMINLYLSTRSTIRNVNGFFGEPKNEKYRIIADESCFNENRTGCVGFELFILEEKGFYFLLPFQRANKKVTEEWQVHIEDKISMQHPMTKALKRFMEQKKKNCLIKNRIIYAYFDNTLLKFLTRRIKKSVIVEIF